MGNGSSPIEPSNKSSQYICNLITTIMHDFKWGVDDSKIYYGGDRIYCEQNTEKAMKMN